MPKNIPLHKLNDRVSIGLEIKHSYEVDLRKEDFLLNAHRDDHYIFFMVEEGAASLLIDFNKVVISAKSIYYILPGQVHHRIDGGNAAGWFIAVDTSLVPAEFRKIFESQLLLQQPYYLTSQVYLQCQSLINILFEQYNSDQSSAFYMQQVHSLLSAFLGTVACGYIDSALVKQHNSRPEKIAQSFKHLLTQHIHTVKQPAQYASMLNISQSYLNESLNKVTGFSVSHLIISEIMLEAKRLLYYSDLTVKEIAHQLGYEDHTYFSRLFKKVNQMTPLAFRKLYRR